MQRRFVLFLPLSLSLFTAFTPAASLPYDEAADAKGAVRQALAEAQTDKRPVLVIFGANWCEDCRALDLSLKTGRNAELIGGAFRVVKVDVGRFDRNLDVAQAYGNPIKKGIPAAVVLSADDKVLYATKAGELADARRMSDTGVYSFFENVVRTSHGQLHP
jgi:protein disulfide-isomerase